MCVYFKIRHNTYYKPVKSDEKREIKDKLQKIKGGDVTTGIIGIVRLIWHCTMPISGCISNFFLIPKIRNILIS